MCCACFIDSMADKNVPLHVRVSCDGLVTCQGWIPCLHLVCGEVADPCNTVGYKADKMINVCSNDNGAALQFRFQQEEKL